jgi:hypothetical protein
MIQWMTDATFVGIKHVVNFVFAGA